MAMTHAPSVSDKSRTRGVVAPAKAVRLLGLLNEGLGELRRAEPDAIGRRRLVARYRDVLIEVASAMSDPLIDELVALGARPLDPDATLDELLVAQVQLSGWLNGVLLAEAELSTQGARRHDPAGATRPGPVVG
jgi:hypothetical protein